MERVVSLPGAVWSMRKRPRPPPPWWPTAESTQDSSACLARIPHQVSLRDGGEGCYDDTCSKSFGRQRGGGIADRCYRRRARKSRKVSSERPYPPLQQEVGERCGLETTATPPPRHPPAPTVIPAQRTFQKPQSRLVTQILGVTLSQMSMSSLIVGHSRRPKFFGLYRKTQARGFWKVRQAGISRTTNDYDPTAPFAPFLWKKKRCGQKKPLSGSHAVASHPEHSQA